MTAIDESIERFDAALREAGLGRLTPPVSLDPLEQIIEAIRPFRVPRDVVRFWERVDLSSVAVTLLPELLGPSGALELHRRNIEARAPVVTGPPLLFPVGYASHVFRFVELESEWCSGGAVFTWAIDEEWIEFAYHGFADLIDTAASVIEDGELERVGGFVVVPAAPEEERRAARLHDTGLPARYPEPRVYRPDLRRWPAHWLASAGVDLASREPLGATHTIAGLVEAAENRPVRARVHGTVIRLTGSSDGALVGVADATGSLEVWCPTEASLWGPAHRQRFEFNLVIEPPTAAASAAAAFAVAVDVRPLE